MNAAREHADASAPEPAIGPAEGRTRWRGRPVRYLFGPLTRFGQIAARIVGASDQAV